MSDPGPATHASVVLYQFAFSHFNEKARWGLDWKGLPHRRRNLLPGFHARQARKLSGASEVPIAVVDGRVIAGSTPILRRLEELAPEPALFPAHETQRKEAEEWLAWLDAEVGPAVRLGLFHDVLVEPDFAREIFAVGQPAWKRLPYTWLFPRMVPMLRERMGITDESAARDNAKTARALDRVAAATAATGYLVGETFTVADLTAAALLFPLSFPPELSFSTPDRPSAAFDGWKSRWAGHEGVKWMEGVYRQHRVARRDSPPSTPGSTPRSTGGATPA